MPTGAGKTRIAELAILRFLIDTVGEPEKICLYIAPYRSLATEVERSLQRSFNALGIRVSELHGGFDFNPAEAMLFGEARVLILTPEKADALLRYKPELVGQIGLLSFGTYDP
jgi:replicative superfamily II helicase